MTEQFLDDEDVRTRFQQVGCKAVAQRVWCDRLGDTRFFLALLNTVSSVRVLSGLRGSWP